MKKISIGTSDYKTVIEKDCYYIDKTEFIKDIINIESEVILITRPRRFGKTLNLSMLQYFFEISESKNDYLFYNKKIWEQAEYHEKQGIYPVIFISFKDAKEDNWIETWDGCFSIISEEYDRHQYLLDTLKPRDAEFFEKILKKKGSSTDLTNSLKYLTKFLHNYHKQKVMVLIDEYDAPIDSAYINGYYKQAIGLMRSLLTKVLKDNKFLAKGVLTGVLQIAKESIFSELNNVDTFPLLRDDFSDKFGFTSKEVDQMLIDYNFLEKSVEIKKWYNGYTFGSTTIYNPWSLLKCIEQKGNLMTYWVNTGGNQLLKKIIVHGGTELISELQDILITSSIEEKRIDEAFIYPNIEENSDAAWSLLVFTGYLTYNTRTLKDGGYFCNLIIPNKEIQYIYKKLIEEIIKQVITPDTITQLLTALTYGNSEKFANILQTFIMDSISVFDISDKESEKSYHLFILGLLMLLKDNYVIKSNKESGLGRYDIMLIPRDKSRFGIIIEFKKISPEEKISLEEMAQKALQQIKDREYTQELYSHEINNILSLGIAFKGKKIFVKSEKSNLPVPKK